MPKFCPKCGNQIIDDASLFCNNCGSQLPMDQQEVVQSVIYPPIKIQPFVDDLRTPTQPITKKSIENDEIKQNQIEKSRSKTLGFIIISIGGILLFIVLLSLISSSGTNNTGGYTSKVTTPTPTVKITLERNNLKTGTGEAPIYGGIAVYVDSIHKTNQYSYYSDIFKETQFETTPPGKTFVFVIASVKNIGTNSIYASPTSFSITDSLGRKYDPDFMYFGDDGFKMQQLYPNQITYGKILFTIPSDARGLKLQYDFGNLYSGPNLVTWPFD